MGAFTRTADGRVIPQFTTSSGFYILGPADFAKIYNIPSTLDGTGTTIAIVADSNINPQDVTDFRNLFGLPANPPVITLDGPDPGLGLSEGEADLDVEVAGMVAPKAKIDLVVSEDTLTALGIDLSALYIVDNNIADAMSESFGACEAALGTANVFFNSLWEQAAAQGITVTVAAGDPGSAGCDDFNAETAATLGLAVSGIASTPFNIAVGGTDFDDVGNQTTFWSASGSASNAPPTRESALGYIPETTWNDSCAATATSATLNTVCVNPADGISAGSPPSCVPDSGGHFSFFGVGGTSASSPAFAGIMALINQSQVTAGKPGRQGNANLVLYKIAATAGQSCDSSTSPLTGSTCSFNDVTKGNNSVPCAGNSPNCSSKTANTNGVLVSTASPTTPAWTTATGYDLATGLGSVNVTNLAAAWTTTVGAFKASTTSLKLNGATSTVTITHGTSVAAAVTVAQTSGTVVPTGDVSLIAPTSVNGGIGSGTLSSGIATLNTTFLPGGSYNVKAHYAGDGTFAPSDDATGVPVVVNKENSRLQMGIVTFDPVTGNLTSTNATSFAYGSPYILRLDILNSLGTNTNCQPLTQTNNPGCAFDATGSVAITDNAAPLDTGTFVINSAGHAEDQPIQLNAGSHSIVATYSGDISYSAPSASSTATWTVSKATTATGLAATPATGVTTATPVTLTATIASQSNSTAGPGGTVTFFNGGTQIGSPVTVVPAGATAIAFASGTASLQTTFTSTGTQTITATYSGDSNYATSNAPATTITVASTGSFTVGGSAVTAIAGSSGTSTITVTPTGGFTGNVNVTCPATGLPAGVTCSPNPLAINVTGTTAVTGSLTVAVAAPSTSLSASAAPVQQKLMAAGMIPSRGGKGWLALGAGAGLGALILLVLPGRKRFRAALGLGLVCVLGFSLGCNSYGGGGGGGLATTTTKITVTSTKVAQGTNIAFSIAVTSTGTAANGQVQLFDGTSTLGSSVTVSNGSAMISNAGLLPGTHAISAHYLGDTYTQASQSGALNVAVTGTTSFVISATPAASNGTPMVNLTIN